MSYLHPVFLYELFQSLAQWDPSEPQSLTKVIRELICEYKEHQRKLVEDMPRLQFEYSTLSSNDDYHNYEVHVLKDSQVYFVQ